MATKEQKLNIADITFDDFIGDGLNTLDEQEANLKDEFENEEEPEEDDDSDDSDNSDSPSSKRNRRDEDDDDEELQSNKYSKDDQDEDDEFDEEDSEESGSVAESIAKALGYDIENDYADTEEGLVEFTKDIAQNIAEDQLNELFQQFPLVQKHLDFVLAGGDSEKFFQAYNPNMDYSNYEIDQNDNRTQKAFVSEYFKSKGHDEEFIKDMLEDYEDSGKLYDKAIVAQKQLATIQSREREQIVEQQKREKAEQEKSQEEFWENVAATIDQGKEFAGIRIPEKEKAKFFDYISAPVDKSGKTRRDMDYSNSNLDVKLAIDYLMYKGMNLQDIITTKAKTESVMNLRDKIQRNEERVKNYGKVERNRTKKFDPDQLDMKKLFE